MKSNSFRFMHAAMALVVLSAPLFAHANSTITIPVVMKYKFDGRQDTYVFTEDPSDHTQSVFLRKGMRSANQKKPLGMMTIQAQTPGTPTVSQAIVPDESRMPQIAIYKSNKETGKDLMVARVSVNGEQKILLMDQEGAHFQKKSRDAMIRANIENINRIAPLVAEKAMSARDIKVGFGGQVHVALDESKPTVDSRSQMAIAETFAPSTNPKEPGMMVLDYKPYEVTVHLLYSKEVNN
jgi:hypothetical protein